MKYRWKLESHRTLFEKYFRLDEYSISHELFAGGNSPVFTREIFERGVVVAVLPYDPRRGKVVLIEQFRAGAIDDADGPWLVECVAGVIDAGESERQVALRECVEEAGCNIERLETISNYYVSPGGTSEHCSLFCGIVDSEGVGGIHGLSHEHEDIRVMVMDAEQAYAWVRVGRIRSSATIIALLWLELNESRLRDESA
ncbi:MAG: NUDIX domain-containing protein [Gammaproteobacteria bacterium]|jgi:ADP-ribose pyrophosphatase|nr:NUDIX domain-containing protein [Gammaproteobacteria bacterium]